MTVLIAVPVVIALAAIGAVWWIRSRRGDVKSIEAHRCTLGVIEHVAAADDAAGAPLHRARTHDPSGPHDPSRSHVRIIGRPPGARPEPAHDDGVMPGRLPRRTDRPSFPLPRDRSLHPPTVPTVDAPEDTAPAPAARRRPKEPPVPLSAPAGGFDLTFTGPTGA